MAKKAVRGADQMRRRLRNIAKNLQADLADSLDEVANDLLDRSNALAKQKTGLMIEGGAIWNLNSRDTFIRVVFYKELYAVIQHEDPSYGLGPISALKPGTADGGVGLGWLSRPFELHAGEYIDKIGNDMFRSIQESVRRSR